MTESRYRFLAALSTDDGRSLGRLPISPDWYPAKEAARFRAQRRAGAPPDAAAHIVPLWDADLGMPYVDGVRVDIADSRDEEPGCVVSPVYFRAEVQSLSSQLVKEGVLKEGDTFHYRIVAFPCPEEPPSGAAGAGNGWIVEEVSDSCICGERSVRSYLAASEPVNAPDSEDYPVFIPPAILMQAEALKTEAEEKETGGILIGYLWRDSESTEIFAEVTALVPAQHTVAQSTKLTFTAETWEAVQTAIRLRRRGEIFLAWHHTHPSRFWCRCEPEAQKQCPLGKQFFSADDCALHRTVFSRAFHVALVTGDRPLEAGGWEMDHALYGWRNGTIVPRGYHLLRR